MVSCLVLVERMMIGMNNFLSSIEVCRYCGFSVSVLNRLASEKKLMPVRKLPTNGRRLYRQEDVDNYLNTICTEKNDSELDVELTK